MRGQEAARQERSGLLRERFPVVQRLSVRLNFSTPQQHALDQETRSFGPADPCDFSATCPGRCGGKGSFDLAAKINAVVEGRQTRAEGSGVCQEPLYAGASDVCGFRLSCVIEVNYAGD